MTLHEHQNQNQTWLNQTRVFFFLNFDKSIKGLIEKHRKHTKRNVNRDMKILRKNQKEMLQIKKKKSCNRNKEFFSRMDMAGKRMFEFEDMARDV